MCAEDVIEAQERARRGQGTIIVEGQPRAIVHRPGGRGTVVLLEPGKATLLKRGRTLSAPNAGETAA